MTTQRLKTLFRPVYRRARSATNDGRSPRTPPFRSAQLDRLPLTLLGHPHDANGIRLVPTDIGLRRAQSLERERHRDGILVELPHRLPHRARDPKAACAIGLVEQLAKFDF